MHGRVLREVSAPSSATHSNASSAASVDEAAREVSWQRLGEWEDEWLGTGLETPVWRGVNLAGGWYRAALLRAAQLAADLFPSLPRPLTATAAQGGVLLLSLGLLKAVLAFVIAVLAFGLGLVLVYSWFRLGKEDLGASGGRRAAAGRGPGGDEWGAPGGRGAQFYPRPRRGDDDLLDVFYQK